MGIAWVMHDPCGHPIMMWLLYGHHVVDIWTSFAHELLQLSWAQRSTASHWLVMLRL